MSLSPDEDAALELAAEGAIAYRRTSGKLPVPPRVGVDEAVARFRTDLPEDGQPATRVIEDILTKSDGAINQMTSPDFYGYVLGGSMPVGVAADMLVAAWGQNAGSAMETPAITGMERAVCDWCLDLLGLPGDCGVGIVTGATVANTQGVMAARHALLSRQGWDVEAKGLFAAPEIPVLIGDAAHSAPFAALRYAGFGAERVTRVKTDEDGQIDAADFHAALDACQSPPLVILQAGQINTGGFDPFAELIPAVRARGGWVHIDGAFGLWLAAVPELAGRLAGVEQADSWAVDLHKWLNAPFDAGLCIVRDRGVLVNSMSARGAYLPDLLDHWEPTDSTLELSRRARGVPSYAILKHLGRSGVRELVLRHCRLAEYLAEAVGGIDGLAVVNTVTSNQVAIRATIGADSDASTREILKRVQERGRVYPTHGEWHGSAIIRVSIIGYATQKIHIDQLVDELRQATKQVNK